MAEVSSRDHAVSGNEARQESGSDRSSHRWPARRTT
jgi:hypothetical protein